MKSLFLLPILLPLLGLIVLMNIEETNAYCCKVNGGHGWPPNCNVFGCNCDCQKCDSIYDKSCCAAEYAGVSCPANRMRRSLLESIHFAKRTFESVDDNHDGSVDVEEAAKYLAQQKGMNQQHLLSDKAWFKELDKNGNGKLESMEFDGALNEEE